MIGVSNRYAHPPDAATDAASGAVGGLIVPRQASPYLLTADVAARLRCSVRKVHELTRTLAIPHRKLPGSRRCLFVLSELEAWEAGAELEVKELAGDGRIVRPKGES